MFSGGIEDAVSFEVSGARADIQRRETCGNE
jgi:hypothetical protein